ncbi:MAG: protein-L-isoaspartate(D-aspartate) O-methyltransferase [Bacteroidota bacterium]
MTYLKIFFLLLFTTVLHFDVKPQDSDDRKRLKMVEEQIIARGISHEATIEAFKTVPRHLYVAPKYQRWAYMDRPIPIGYGQTISQPYIVAYMTEMVDPDSNYNVLEIGTGSGYQAAILAEIVNNVYTIEIIPELGQSAKELLEKHYNNVFVKIADGYYGWEEKGPFDAIIVTAAAEYIPPPLIEQLKEGGKMVIPVGSAFMTQQLVLVEKSDEQIFTKNLMPVRFVPFTRKE